MQPIELGPNQPQQFYRGGEAISELRGAPFVDQYRPEDWVASSTPRFGLEPDGLSSLPEGGYLRDALGLAPEEWLGPDHVAYFGSDPALLVKLLDAGERLPVHVHPDRSYALRHLGSRHGKTEAWIILGTRGAEPTVHLGWSHDVEGAELSRWVAEQDREAMLGNLHRLTVHSGDAVLVPAGTAHAIGEGVFCVELQEPTDFSVMLELEGFDIDPNGGELGLGRDLALSCVRHGAFSADDVESLRRRGGPVGVEATPGVQDVFPAAANPYFRAQRVRGGRGVDLEASFAVVVVVDGSGQMQGGGWELALERGKTLVVPWAAGPCRISGRVELLRCLPPLPAEAANDNPGS
jgi:mannose-6-phosphate isomerase